MLGVGGSSGSLTFPMSYDYQSEIFDSRGTGRGWRNYSSLEKTLWMSLGAACLIVIGLIIAVSIVGVELQEKNKPATVTKAPTTTIHPPWLTSTTTTTTVATTTRRTTTTKPPGWNQCLEMECVLAAARVKSSIDDSVSPCDDFYQYACGGWIKRNPIPPTEDQWDQIGLMENRLFSQIKDILTVKINVHDTAEYPKSYFIARDFYDACLEQDKLENNNDVSALAKFANESVGNLAADLSLLGETLGNIRRDIEGNFLFSLYVDLDAENSSNTIIYLDQPRFGLGKSLLVNNDEQDQVFRDAYRNLTAKVWAVVFPHQANEAWVLADTILDFEIALAKISASEEDRLNQTALYNPYTLGELKELTNLNWESYFAKVFLDIMGEETNSVQFQNHAYFEEETYIVRDIALFERLIQTIEAFTPTELSNYLKWRILFEFGDDVNAQLRNLFLEYYQTTRELVLAPSRWKVCTKQTNEFFGMVISHIYVEEQFSDDVMDKAKALVDEIQTSFLQGLDELDWIDQETKDLIGNKTTAIASFVGHPSWIKNQAAIDEYYLGLKLDTPTDHFKNLLQVYRWHSTEELTKILNPKDPDTWLLDPTVIRSLYSPNYNSITFPAAMLQTPLYRMPLEALNYGAIGALIGHELIQAFAPSGMQYDGDGNLGAWQNETVLETYLEMAECFVTQYDNYTIEEDGRMLNGRLALDMNIADNGGLSQAFKAFQTYTQQLPQPEKLLPGMTEYNSNQLFFLSYAQSFCGSYKQTVLQDLVASGTQTPNRFRVQGALQNSVEFAETWACPVPNPNTTCLLW